VIKDNDSSFAKFVKRFCVKNCGKSEFGLFYRFSEMLKQSGWLYSLKSGISLDFCYNPAYFTEHF